MDGHVFFSASLIFAKLTCLAVWLQYDQSCGRILFPFQKFLLHRILFTFGSNLYLNFFQDIPFISSNDAASIEEITSSGKIPFQSPPVSMLMKTRF